MLEKIRLLEMTDFFSIIKFSSVELVLVANDFKNWQWPVFFFNPECLFRYISIVSTLIVNNDVGTGMVTKSDLAKICAQIKN